MMKKSKFIKLVLVTGALATACNTEKQKTADWGDNDTISRLNVRTDTTSNEYTRHRGGYFHMFPLGYMLMGSYFRSGYGSNGLHPRTSSQFSGVNRGGFGKSAYRVGS